MANPQFNALRAQPVQHREEPAVPAAGLHSDDIASGDRNPASHCLLQLRSSDGSFDRALLHKVSESSGDRVEAAAFNRLCTYAKTIPDLGERKFNSRDELAKFFVAAVKFAEGGPRISPEGGPRISPEEAALVERLGAGMLMAWLEGAMAASKFTVTPVPRQQFLAEKSDAGFELMDLSEKAPFPGKRLLEFVTQPKFAPAAIRALRGE